MDALHRIEYWADTHHPVWLDFVRIGLGIFIMFKGVLFISNTTALLSMMRGADLAFATMALAHYVAFAHLVGGLLIALGLLTRMAVIFQLPILFGAVFFINMDGFFTVANNLEFGLSILTLLLLIVFLMYGSGKFSLDAYMRQHPNA